MLAGDTVLDLGDLHVDFDTDDGVVRAVRGVSYSIKRGQTIGVVGESGSGKSVTHLALLDLLPETATISADVMRLAGRSMLNMSAKERRSVRGNEIAMIFQDPMTALNPFLTVGTQIAEMFRLHHGLRGQRLVDATIQALADVGIPRPERRIEDYPHEFSGGMRQRVMIAMMLAGNPELLIADEPTTALDVTVQAQILDLLAGLQRDRGMSIVLITHDLGVVAGFAHRTLVMYAGRVVEEAETSALFWNPQHPYTRGLLSSIPRLDRGSQKLRQIVGAPPDLSALPQGCPFAPRCDFVEDRCREQEPLLAPRGDGHTAACVVTLPKWEGAV